MLFGIAVLCFLYAPLLTFLKSPPTKEEKKVSDGNVDDPNRHCAISRMASNCFDNLGHVLNDQNSNTEQNVTKL